MPGTPNKADSVVGSLSNTSSAAPAITPSVTAFARSASLMMPPRATLIMRNDGLALANMAVLKRLMVSLFFGRCTVMKSDFATRSSNGNNSIFKARARSSDTNGSNATMRIPNAAARCATNLPMRPRPTTPSVLSKSSTPSHLLRSQRPCTNAA